MYKNLFIKIVISHFVELNKYILIHAILYSRKNRFVFYRIAQNGHTIQKRMQIPPFFLENKIIKLIQLENGDNFNIRFVTCNAKQKEVNIVTSVVL